MEFRERLYQLRKGRGISQEELANAVGVSRQAVQKWEAGASTPDLNNLSALAGYFSVTLDYLVRGVEPEAPQAAPAERTVIHNYYTPYHYEYRSWACPWCISTWATASAGPGGSSPSATWPPALWPLAASPPDCSPSAGWASAC